MKLGKTLLELRKSKKLSQEDVASILKVSRQTISKWETDQSIPDLDKILPICNLYDIDADELLNGKKKEETTVQEKIIEKEIIVEKDNDSIKELSQILALIFFIIYLIISIKTMAWYITWLIWIIYFLVIGIIKSINNKSIIKTIIFSIASVIITLIMISFLNGNSLKITNKKVIYDNLYFEDFKKILVNSSNSNIDIKESQDDSFRVVITGNKNNFIVDNYNNRLYIENNSRCKFLCLKNSKIIVYVPSKYKEEIDINNRFGNVNIENFKYANINIDSKFNDIKIDNVNSITINNDLGNISIKNINNYFDLDNDFGDIKIDNVNILLDSYIDNNLGDIKIGNTNEINIYTKNDLGNIRVNKNYRESNILLDIKTNLGNIKIINQ